jgi:hypothetical protein
MSTIPSQFYAAIPAVLLSMNLLLLPDLQAEPKTAPLPKPSPKKDLTFEVDIMPLFERSCTKCHGEEKQKAKLRLDSRESALAGAGDEKVIIPGKSAASELVLVIAKATDDEEEWMPPPGKAKELSPEEIGLIRAWIDQGAH